MQQFISVVLIFPPTRVTVSLQGPDGDYEITAATAKLKCVNQKDLFVPAFWLEDARTAKKKKNAPQGSRSQLQSSWIALRPQRAVAEPFSEGETSERKREIRPG